MVNPLNLLSQVHLRKFTQNTYYKEMFFAIFLLVVKIRSHKKEVSVKSWYTHKGNITIKKSFEEYFME